MDPLKIALCQILVGKVKEKNLEAAKKCIQEAASKGCKLVVLPECFNSPYGTKYFPEYAEEIKEGSVSVDMLCESAKEAGVFLIGGSIPERHNGRLYNTALIVNPDGDIIAKHRKIHLFNIDIPGKITFRESDALTAGESPTMFDMPGFGKIGVAICFDVRFPELAEYYRQNGCRCIVYPGAFNMTTGPAHWKLLAQARALDTQSYVCMCSPAQCDPVAAEQGDYVAYGHSMVVNAWGDVVAEAGSPEQIVIETLDSNSVDLVRKQLPVIIGKRSDLFEVVKKL